MKPYAPPPPIGTYGEGQHDFEKLRARTESSQGHLEVVVEPEPAPVEPPADLLERIAEAGASKRAARGENMPRRINIDVSAKEHAALAEHARRAGLTLREVIRIALKPVLRKP